MDSIFGRKNKLHKPRQPSVSDLADRSVPYDRLAPSPRSPNFATNFISAPITNPTLTPNGTELNKFAMARAKKERADAYDTFATASSASSVSTNDSSTLYTDSLPSPSKTTNFRRSEASFTSSSGLRSPAMSDFAQFPPPTPNSVYNFAPGSPSVATMRPVSGMTTRSDNRTSKYAPSFTSSDSSHSHLPHFHLHRQSNGDDFNFPRPETDEEIEALFENVKRTRDLGDLPNLPIEQKWHMVYNDYHIRWKEDKAREDQARRQVDSGQPAPIMNDSPEWFIRKFLDKTITPKQAGSLLVSLRSKELRCVAPQFSARQWLTLISWFRHFIAIRGTSVLAQTLMHLSRKGASR